MTDQDACDEDLIDLNPDCVVRPIGVVQATNTREVHKLSDCMDWKFLKSGKTMEISTGSSLLVKHRLGYIQAQFFEPGSIKGPLVFAENTLEEPEDALRKSSKFQDEVCGYAAGVFVFAGSAILSQVLNGKDYFSVADLSLNAFLGLGSGICALKLFKVLRAGFSCESNAIKKLKALELGTYENGREIPPPDLDLERCVSDSRVY